MAFRQFEMMNFRPEGFEFPVGLSTSTVTVGATTFNVATNSTGGSQTVVGDMTYHTFTSSGTFQYSPTAPGHIEYCAVGAGGGGGVVWPGV